MRVNADAARCRPSLCIYLPKAASSGCASLTPDFCNCSGTIEVFTAMPALAHIAAEPHLSDARLESTSGQRRINFLSAVLGRLQPAIPGPANPAPQATTPLPPRRSRRPVGPDDPSCADAPGHSFVRADWLSDDGDCLRGKASAEGICFAWRQYITIEPIRPRSRVRKRFTP